MKTTKFKPSELGPIPVEWEVRPLRQVGTFSKGSGVSRSESNSGVLPCVRYGEIYTDHSDYIKSFRSFISENVASTAKLLSPGDILFAGSGETKEEIGKAVAYLGGFDRAYCGGDVIILSPISDNDPKYLGYVCNSDSVVVQKSARGQGDAVVHIRSGSLAEVVVPVPPLSEQKKIAEALSDVDALLAAMTTLIEKKRAIKQGAMQQLLTGKKRLAGFTGEWVERRVSDIGTVVTGSTPPRCVESFWVGDFPWISAKDFRGKYIVDSEEHISEMGKKHCRILPMNAVLVTCIASIGLNAIAKVPCATNQQINAVVCASCDAEYFYYQICHVTNDLKQMAGQTAVPIIGKSQFENQVIWCPPTLAEQQAIAAVLSDMDAEIAALEAKRAKYEQIKQGMMQELLTGKVRLV